MKWEIRQAVDLACMSPQRVTPECLFAVGDSLAHRWRVTVCKAGVPVDLTGWTATAMVQRPDGAVTPVPGVVDADSAYVDLTAACCACTGHVTALFTLAKGAAVVTVAEGRWRVGGAAADVVVDPDAIVPSLPELLAQISAMQDATAACTEATVAAEAAIRDAAPPVVTDAAGAVALCHDAAPRDAVTVLSTITAVVTGDPAPDSAGDIATRDTVRLWHGAAYDESAEPELSETLPEPVYGGTLDWTTGVLTVTHIVHEAQNLVWKASSLMAGRYVAACRQAAVTACTHYPCGSIADDGCIFRSAVDQIGVNSDFATLDEWKAWLAAQAAAGSPVRILIEQVPERQTTAQLTPQRLTMTAGTNALWSDTGDTSVSYIADTKAYIDNALAAIAAAVIAQ